jgi:hypothetical protein
VLPILESTKDEPLVKWGTRAICDVKQIAAWWRQWPHANIGCASGPSGLAVIDTDNKPEGDGENNHAISEETAGELMAAVPLD